MKYIIIIAIIVSLLIGLFSGSYFFPRIVNKNVFKKDTLFSKDTLINYIDKPRLIVKTKAELIYIKDTIIETKPFIASLDTIIKDTIGIKYYFPNNHFLLDIRYKPDEIKIVTQTITIEVEKHNTFFDTYMEKPLYIAGSLLAGYGLGRIK